MADKEDAAPWKLPFTKTGYALIELVCHLAIVAVFLMGIEGLRLLMTSIGLKDHVFLSYIPLKYVFDAADLFLLAGLLALGSYSVIRAYWGDRS